MWQALLIRVTAKGQGCAARVTSTAAKEPEELRFLFQVAEPNLTCKMTDLCWGERGGRTFGSLAYDISSNPSAQS